MEQTILRLVVSAPGETQLVPGSGPLAPDTGSNLLNGDLTLKFQSIGLIVLVSISVFFATFIIIKLIRRYMITKKRFDLVQNKSFSIFKSFSVLLIFSIIGLSSIAILNSLSPANAEADDALKISTVGTLTLNAELKEKSPVKICGTDVVKINLSLPAGYDLDMYANDLALSDDENVKISSVSFAKEPAKNEWGYVLTDDINSGNVLPISNNSKTIKNISVKTEADDTTNISYCVNLDPDTKPGVYETQINYSINPHHVISSGTQELLGGFSYEIDEDSDEDLDSDGLTNKQEKEYGTNPLSLDSDLDGLDDYYEIYTSLTNPNKEDTDDDGLSDYDEIELGLDPNDPDSYHDGVKDGERTLSYNYNSGKVTLQITGKGNIASTVAKTTGQTKISNKEGLIDNLYTLYTDGNIEEAILTISYTDEELATYGIDEDNLSIYYYNSDEMKYEKIDSVVDKTNKTVTAVLHHFSNYLLGDALKVKESYTSQILFVIDNSWSMYTNEQYKYYTGEEWDGIDQLDGYDANGLRFSLTSRLATSLASRGYQIGLSEFRRDYANALPIGSDIGSITSALSTMQGHFITSSAGTNIRNALNKAMDEFPSGGDNKYVVLLTDGQDDSLSSYAHSIMNKAESKNVKICSIGFGGGANNTILSNISNVTGCNFYSSSDADGLVELIDNLGTELEDNLVDIDGDGKMDGMMVADSGFVVNRDGFSFGNYGSNLSNNGHCYGMAAFAELYYLKNLPLTSGAKNTTKFNGSKYASYPYDLTSTYFENYANLYNFKLKTNALKYTFGFELFNEEQPNVSGHLRGTTLAIDDGYKREATSIDIYDSFELKSTLGKKAQIERYGFNYETYEEILLNEDSMQASNTIYNDEKQILNAIYASYIRQFRDTFYFSSTNLTAEIRNIIGLLYNHDPESYDEGAAGFINILKARLLYGDPVVISSHFYGNGGHAINAINLIQDIDNPNHYYVGVYDNNFPGEKRYIDIECDKETCLTIASTYNKEYKGDKQSIGLTMSLEYDLEYYNN